MDHRSLRAATVVAALALAGCAGQARPPAPVIQIQRVNVPIEVARTPPAELLLCNEGYVAPHAVPLVGVATGISFSGAALLNLQLLIDGLLTCTEAWETWAVPAKVE